MDSQNSNNRPTGGSSGNGNNQIEGGEPIFYRIDENIQLALVDSTVEQIDIVAPDADLPPNQVQAYCHDLAMHLKESSLTVSEINFDYFPVTGQPLVQLPLRLYSEVYNATTEELSGNETNQSSLGNEIQFQDLFHEASRLAESETRRWENETAKQKHRLIHGNIVGVSGKPGIGKTTLTKMIAKEIVVNNLFNAQFIFYIQLRDINYIRSMNLLKFLLSSTDIQWEHETRKDNAILRYLDKRIDVVIIMDGLNETAISSLAKIVPAVSLFDEATPEEFIKNLLGGKILTNAKKILTSRPYKLYELHHHYRPRCVVNLLGINEDSQKILCRSVCATQDCLHNAERVYHCISTNSSISSYSYNPLNCIFSAYCINSELQLGREVNVMGSITKLFTLVLEKFVESDHVAERFKYETLAKLAWKGLVQNKLYFSQREIDQARQNAVNYQTFLHMRVHASAPPMKILTGQKRFSFSHVVLQEFLAAVHLRYQMPVEEFRVVAESLYESRFESVAKFLFGLFNQDAENRLFVQVQSAFGLEEHAKLQIMKDTALGYVRNVLALKDRRSFSNLLRICCCVHELQEDQFAENVAVCLGKKLNIIGQVFPSDVAGFCFVLRSIKENFQFFVGPCLSFFGNSLPTFFEELQDIILQTQIFMPVVDLAHNKVDNRTAHMLCRCLTRIHVLRLCDCRMMSTQVKIIANSLTKSLENLSELNLSYNNLGDTSTPFIAICLNKVNKLHLSDCSFNEESIATLSEAIAAKQQMLQHFCISRNITTGKLCSISKCIGKINNLVIGFRHESPNIGLGLQALSKAIAGRAEPMECLFLRGSHIGDEGFIAVSKCLKKIKQLKLYNTYDENLTSLGIRELSAAFSRLEYPMEEFVFTAPAHYLDEAKREFEYCSENITKLYIR